MVLSEWSPSSLKEVKPVATTRVGLLALVPAVVDSVTPLPVIAAGGIANGRAAAAALALELPLLFR